MIEFLMLSLNARGLQENRETFTHTLIEFLKWKKERGLTVLCLQDHNIPSSRKGDLQRLASLKNVDLIMTEGHRDAQGTAHGGVLIMIDSSKMTLKKVKHEHPSLVCVEAEMGERTLEIASVYAPSDPQERVNFFREINTKQLLSANTFVGGDWNVVEDVTMDVRSANPLGYDNTGIQALRDALDPLGLIDIMREQIHNKREYSRGGNTRNGYTSTRIDRWYTPDIDELLMTAGLTNEFVYKDRPSDHMGVWLRIEDQQGEIGSERETIAEDLLQTKPVQDEVLLILRDSYKGNRSNVNKWKKAHNRIRDYLMRETKKRRKKVQPEIKILESKLKILGYKKKAGSGSRELDATEKKIATKIRELKYPETKTEITEARAHEMAQRSDKCTRSFFKSYKDQAKQQWVNKVAKIDWVEGDGPTDQELASAPRTSNTKEVGTEFVKLYKMIFDKKVIDGPKSQQIFDRLRRKAITKPSRDALDRDVTVEEVEKTMENLPTGKQAGPNRVPNAVYKYMSAAFAPKLTEILNDCTAAGKLPGHFLEGDISMLFKKNDREDPRNYRPITLLNTDYKIFTRILSKRMAKVVHEFVSESQKGFVPDTFIAEASMLLRMIESYINDEPSTRKGAFLFLDMEKAFDRVSYEFTKKGLQALGFGPRFRKWVGMMYDEENAPRRRIYMNGYYSEWFQIKSGVAQGCPLSPLLFLIVAEALKDTIDCERKIKGVNIHGRRYKISQFADDTTLILGSLKELTAANKAIKRWCDATGMRENIKKREGLAMGRYRSAQLPDGVKWAKEGGWCISLGVPIGNDLSDEKWWSAKITEVRSKAKRWMGLYRSSYFGRNLIVQAMYFGRLRYWLYSLLLSPRLDKVIQKDADILWWSREPELENVTDNGLAAKNPKRTRGWVRKSTAMGPIHKGGLNKMDWAEHASCFRAQWIIRYLDPSDSGWKRILDGYLLRNAAGDIIYHDRGAVISNLTQGERARMMKRIPQRSRYVRACLKEFWQLNLQPEKTWEHIGSAPVWRSHLIPIKVKPHVRKYCEDTLDISIFSDFMNNATNRAFTMRDWRDFIVNAEIEKTGVRPTNAYVLSKAITVVRIQRQIPREALRAMRRGDPDPPHRGEQMYLIRHPILWPARYTANGRAMRLKIDAVGKPHETGEMVDTRPFARVPPVKWGEAAFDDRTDVAWNETKWAGPKGAVYHAETKWKRKGLTPTRLGDITIKKLTKSKAASKFKPPDTTVWRRKIGYVNYERMWKLRAMYVTPRDKIVWQTLQHRTLWTAHVGGMGSTQCSVPGCSRPENQQHLADCQHIQAGFWTKIHQLMQRLGLKSENSTKFRITGIRADGKIVDKESAALMFWAWRALYAETVRAHLENKPMRLDRAYAYTIELAHARVRAHGFRWRQWYLRQRYIPSARSKVIPERHRSYKLLKTDPYGTYQVNPILAQERSTTMNI